VTRRLEAAVVPILQEAVLKSMAQIMKVDIAERVKRLVLQSNSTCCEQTEVFTADERTRGSSSKAKKQL
jgi:polyphosphate kinase